VSTARGCLHLRCTSQVLPDIPPFQGWWPRYAKMRQRFDTQRIDDIFGRKTKNSRNYSEIILIIVSKASALETVTVNRWPGRLRNITPTGRRTVQSADSPHLPLYRVDIQPDSSRSLPSRSFLPPHALSLTKPQVPRGVWTQAGESRTYPENKLNVVTAAICVPGIVYSLPDRQHCHRRTKDLHVAGVQRPFPSQRLFYGQIGL
jgi:hypothetical protein